MSTSETTPASQSSIYSPEAGFSSREIYSPKLAIVRLEERLLDLPGDSWRQYHRDLRLGALALANLFPQDLDRSRRLPNGITQEEYIADRESVEEAVLRINGIRVSADPALHFSPAQDRESQETYQIEIDGTPVGVCLADHFLVMAQRLEDHAERARYDAASESLAAEWGLLHRLLARYGVLDSRDRIHTREFGWDAQAREAYLDRFRPASGVEGSASAAEDDDFRETDDGGSPE